MYSAIEEGDVRRLIRIQSQADISANKPRDNVQSLSERVTGRGLSWSSGHEDTTPLFAKNMAEIWRTSCLSTIQ